MNKVFKVIWNEARNAYVVVSEIAKNHGSKSCSTKKLLAMLIATGVMTCASFDVLAAEPSGTDTAKSQYVAFADPTHTLYSGNKTTIDGHEYIYNATNKYWVRKGYKLVVEENGAMHTPLSDHGKSSDVAYIGNGDKDRILQSVASMVSASGTVTNMGESLNKITASGFVGVSHSGGTAVDGTWHYIIHDPTWEGAVAQGNYEDGYVDLVGKNMPKGFVTADDNKGLIWDDDKQAYNYKGKPVDYSNVYVIDGKIGVFTNKDGSDFYEGTVFGKNNEILMTVKDDNGHFYSYWASAVTDPSATMSTYRLAEYKKDLSVLVENDEKLSRNDIKEVTLDTTQANSATIGLLRNGDTEAGAPVKGAITVTSGGGTEGSDTFVKISNGTANQTFATGSKVEVNGPADAITGIKVNGVDYTIKQGSGVKVEQDAANKTTTITVDGNATTITDTDTTYTAGDGIEINGGNAISVSKNLIGMESIQGAGEGKISFDGDNVKVNNTTFGENSVVVGVAGDGKHPVRIDGETGRITGLANTKVGYTDFANDKGTAATEGQLKQVMDEGWKFTTDSNEKTTVKVGPDGTNDNAVTFKGDGTNIAVTNTGKDIKVALKKDLTVDSVKAGDFFMDKNKGVGYVDKAYITSSGLNANNQKITGVADGTNDTDAVNFGQLDATNKKVDNLTTEVGKGWTVAADNGTATKVGAGDTVKFSGADNNIKVSNDGTNVKVELNKELTGLNSVTTKNAYVTEVNEGDKTSVTNVKFVEDKIAGVTLTAGDGISITDKKINVKLKEGEQNLVVDDKGLSMNTILKGMESIEGTGGIINLKGDNVTVNNAVFNKDGRIQNVANGMENTDAVNYGQLQKVSSVANAGWNVSTNGGTATNVKPGDIVDFAGEDNIVVSNTGKNVVVKLGKDLTGLNSVTTNNAYVTNVDASKGSSVTNVEYVKNQITDAALSAGNGISITDKKINVKLKDGEQNLVVDSNGLSLSTALTGIQSITGVGTGAGSISFADGAIKLNNKVTIDNTGKITGVAAGTADTDAVNVSQLKAVGATANMGWSLATNGVATEATNVKPGDYVDFSGDKNISVSHDGTKVKVELNKDIDVNSVQTNALNSKYNLSVGTMAENGIMPFFVNSTGDFYAAHNKFHVDKDGKVTATAGEIGNVVLQNGVYYGHSTLQDGSLLLTDDNGNHSYIDAKSAKLGKVTVTEDGKITGVAAGAITADSTDAVNGSQLHAVATEAGKHSKVVSGNNINVEETDNDGQKIYKVNLNKDIMLGDLTGKYVNISGTNGTIETTGYIATQDRVYADKGAKLADIDVTGNKISNGASSIVLDGSNVKVNDKVTIDQNGKISGVAAGEVSNTSTDAINGSQLHQTNENVAANRADIDKNKADIAALDNRVTKNEQDIKQNAADIATNKANIAQNAADIKKVEELAKKHTTVTAGDNIIVTEDTNKDGGKEYNVALKNNIDLGDNGSVTTGQTVMNNDGLKVGKDVSVTATAVTAGKTSISDEGVKVGDKTYISDKGLNANDQKVTNVAAGELSATSKDAVNGSQLYATNQEVANNTNRINKLGSRVNKVGAGAAALAALHPMDFDPDDKLTFSAGYGNYAGENAAAIGAYYRPDEKVMFSVAGTVGNGENMVNAGVSFALDRTNHVSNSRTALAREVIDLRGQLAVMGAKMAKMEKAFGMLDETKTKLFPDVPANHWAYEYIAKLAGNGYIEGYPDGNFGGDRLMTRYEFAAMLYRAIENGAALEEKIIKEFEPELGRIRVDRISGEDGDRDKIERVRVNDTKGERDHYGNKLAK